MNDIAAFIESVIIDSRISNNEEVRKQRRDSEVRTLYIQSLPEEDRKEYLEQELKLLNQNLDLLKRKHEINSKKQKDNDAAFRAITPPGFAKAFYEANQ